MIRQIQHIKNFGVFSNFRWPATLPELKKFNLIYGWNYSGKTTLSRTLRCFELKALHVDFHGAQVHLKTSDGAVHQLSSPGAAPEIRVFNSDFIRDNLQFEEASATPILVLGAEDIARQASLNAKRAERGTVLEGIDADKRRSSEIESGIERALTNAARDSIKNAFSVPDYDKTRFKRRVEECRADPDRYILDPGSLERCVAVFRSVDKKMHLFPVSDSVQSLANVRNTVVELLRRIVNANRPIQRLTANAAVERWVKEGRHLHDGQSICQYCGQALPSDLVTRLREHFSADYDDLMHSLNVLTARIASMAQEAITLPHRTDLYPELADRFATEASLIEELLAHRRIELDKLMEALREKQTKAFTSVACPEVTDNVDQILESINRLNAIVVEHNARTDDFDKKRIDAFSTIEIHVAACFVRDQALNDQLAKLEDLKNSISRSESQLTDLDNSIRLLEQELSDAVRGAESVNALLLAYFGKKDIELKVTADKRFQIMRGSVVAKNLSEGERTAIAFAHFITRIQDGRVPLSDSIIVIDDPVSSLDANHLFNTYALIKTRLADCKQLFILTHSFEFYGLIREWAGEDEKRFHKPQTEWQSWTVLLVKRRDDGYSVVEEIPKELLRFKSEYHYLFATLYRFEQAGAADFDCMLSLPNVVRRFMEAFGGIMIPRYTGLRGKMDRIFPDPIERERVWKFINHFSHNTTIARSLTIPDTSECVAVVRACLKAVRDWNSDYVDDLESEVTASH